MSPDLEWDAQRAIEEGERRAQEEWDREHKTWEEINDGLPSTEFLVEALVRRGDFRCTATARSRDAGSLPVEVNVYQWVRPCPLN